MTKEVSILPIQSVYSIENHMIAATVLHEEPLVMRFDDVLNEEECQMFIDAAALRLKKSKLANKEESQIRTSSGMFFEENESPLITKIENRISNLMHIPISHAEGLQVLHYEPGQEFKEHYDFFGTGSPSSHNNRISTLIIYLNDVEEGGETTLPRLGITLKPVKGSAIYFEYFYNNQELNELTLHSGKPVTRGEKWVATQWMRKQRIRDSY